MKATTKPKTDQRRPAAGDDDECRAFHGQFDPAEDAGASDLLRALTDSDDPLVAEWAAEGLESIEADKRRRRRRPRVRVGRADPTGKAADGGRRASKEGA